MAVSELIEKTLEPLRKRAEELRPSVDEYNEIQDVLGRLTTTSSSRSASPRARAAATSATAASRRRPARQGGRRDQVVELVRSRPGITIPEIAEAMGIKDNYLYRVTGELQKEGVLRKEDRGFHAIES